MDATDKLIRALYALAVEEDWARFRVLALGRICRDYGLKAAVWMTQASDRAHPGEFNSWPGEGPLTAEQLQALPLKDGAETELDGARRGLALRQPHQDSRLSSRLAFWYDGARPARGELARVIAHLVEAGALALQHFIQSDERLSRWGRSNRGSAAMVDAYGSRSGAAATAAAPRGSTPTARCTPPAAASATCSARSSATRTSTACRSGCRRIRPRSAARSATARCASAWSRPKATAS
jgi:hypothetical protein